MRLGVKQLEELQTLAPSRYMIVAGKTHQREMDRLVDLGVAAYPPPSKASGKKPIGDGGFAVITAKGLAALEDAGLWPHPFDERPNVRPKQERENQRQKGENSEGRDIKSG